MEVSSYCIIKPCYDEKYVNIFRIDLSWLLCIDILFQCSSSSSVGGVKVSMVAFQAVDPGSIPGRRKIFFFLLLKPVFYLFIYLLLLLVLFFFKFIHFLSLILLIISIYRTYLESVRQKMLQNLVSLHIQLRSSIPCSIGQKMILEVYPPLTRMVSFTLRAKTRPISLTANFSRFLHPKHQWHSRQSRSDGGPGLGRYR